MRYDVSLLSYQDLYLLNEGTHQDVRLLGKLRPAPPLAAVFFKSEGP
jgi:hypothetical protein